MFELGRQLDGQRVPDDMLRAILLGVVQRTKSIIAKGLKSLPHTLHVMTKAVNLPQLPPGSMAMPIHSGEIFLPESDTEQHQCFFQLGWDCVNQPLIVILASEMWIGPDSDVMPVDHPDRREAIILMACTADGRELSHVMQFTRGEDGNLSIVTEESGHGGVSALHDFFVGYAQRIESQSGKPN